MAAAFPRCDETPQWAQLRAHHAAQGARFDLRHAFAEDTQRFAHFSQEAPQVFADLSKNLWDQKTEALLLDMASACGLTQRRDAMLAGQRINTTENRPVLHTLLRRPAGLELPGDEPWLPQALQQVHTTLQAMLDCAEALRNDPTITDVVNVGIGGSDLGPQMAVLALEQFRVPGKRFHFVSNIDGHELKRVLRAVRPESTVFLLASKTFTTPETMTNARSALDWFVAQGGQDVARHFVALTCNVESARQWGITTTFGFWDWVGGRYSVDSAIGLSLMIELGPDAFRAFLAGFHAIDEHVASTPLASNVPVLMGLLNVWYTNFLGAQSHAVLPYAQQLSRFAAYLQQLTMESNGKRVRWDGSPVTTETGEIFWGEPGTNGQHAFYQLIHQGTRLIPADFIAFVNPAYALTDDGRDVHGLFLANFLAQTKALAFGKTAEEVEAEGTTGALVAARTFPGNRPTTSIFAPALTPRVLGELIALYEHITFTQGAIWGINSFDQWGVELGKQLALQIAPAVEGDQAAYEAQDASTKALLDYYRAHRG